MNVQVDPLAAVLKDWARLVDDSLQTYVGARLDCPPRLAQAMRYCLFAGGKRLRPMLVLMAADACMGPLDAALPAACAVEMVHTYSLVHDDLPAMDDDALRRGRPSCHCQFDEPTAILVGDALLTLAFETLADVRPATTAVACVRVLSSAAGCAGMVGGQLDDLFAADGPATRRRLESLHARKTGALLTVSLRMGGLIAGADDQHLEALERYGRHVGLAFQIADDLLDVEGDSVVMGKQARKDASAGKLTYPGLLGVKESRRLAHQHVDAARQCLGPLGQSAAQLIALAEFIVERDR